MSNQELVDVEKHPNLARAALLSYLSTQNSKLMDTEKSQFVAIAQRFQLDPFKREIYAVAYGKGDYRKLSIITGYETYLKRAERSGQWDGMKSGFIGKLVKTEIEVERWDNNAKRKVKKKVPVWRADPEVGAVFWCEVYRKDMRQPIREEIDFDEYTQDNSMWFDKPKTMGKKVAKAQAFRAAFPDELGGMPYTADELPDKMTTGNDLDPQKEVKVDTTKKETPPVKNTDKAKKEAATVGANKAKKDAVDAEVTESKVTEPPPEDNEDPSIMADFKQRMKSCGTEQEVLDDMMAFQKEMNLEFSGLPEYRLIVNIRVMLIRSQSNMCTLNKKKYNSDFKEIG